MDPQTECKEILRRMQVPDHDGLFVLGCHERPATFFMQQMRALNLIYALNRKSQPDTLPSLAVIGAGAAGVTAAAAAAICNWKVTIFDRIQQEVLSFAGSDIPNYGRGLRHGRRWQRRWRRQPPTE
jgi:threonine dehydrogenase-like Zn-dependent dehydrogenase